MYVLTRSPCQARNGKCSPPKSTPLKRSTYHPYARCVSTGPLPPRPYTHHWNPKDRCLLRTTTEAQGNRSIHNRNRTDTSTVAVDRFLDRAIRHLRSLWGLLCYDCELRGEHTRSGAVHTRCTEQGKWGKKKRRV